AVEENALCTLNLGSRVQAGMAEDPKTINGQTYPLVIGADGVWSALRDHVEDGPQPKFSGNAAWRFTMPANSVASWLSAGDITAFVGSHAHMVVYPLKDTASVNLVAIASGINPGDVWDAKASDEQRRLLVSQFKRWNRRLIDLI